MAIITLTTDYGTADWFVGSLKGAILSVDPQANIVDITHGIPAGDIRAGAFALAASYRCFPRLTIHMAVVDPGVGSRRAALVIRTADYFFVGPDNGIFSFALDKEKVLECWQVRNENYFRKPVSATFHGRDVFAPVAAHIGRGIVVDSLGEKIRDYVRLDFPPTEVKGRVLEGKVIHIDHFGNCITNIDAGMLARAGSVAIQVLVNGQNVGGVRRYYQEVPVSEPLALVGSAGFLELAVNGGNAAVHLGVKVGDVVEVRV